MISARPAEVEDRTIPGHWENDLILGLRRSAIGTLVERTTRFTILLHLPTDEEKRAQHAQTATGVRGAVMGHGAEAVRDAIAAAITTLPDQLRRSLIWDQGAEMARHTELRIDHDLPVYFCDPHGTWQRGTNENSNELLHLRFPKGTSRPVATNPGRRMTERDIYSQNGSKLFRRTEPPLKTSERGTQSPINPSNAETERLASQLFLPGRCQHFISEICVSDFLS